MERNVRHDTYLIVGRLPQLASVDQFSEDAILAAGVLADSLSPDMKATSQVNRKEEQLKNHEEQKY